ncbi:DNA translocase FtsK 4TM domain-containing protein [Ectothiorhodospiraceae bacterium WFHF3C12]|nr:DNA translocase FtsK 4TM domain-containing protein [Ectothiorhodospiraceae bacterium WFHF3C12]
MANSDNTASASPPLVNQAGRLIREAALWVLLAVAAFLLLALVTYDQSDPGWSYSTNADFIRNVGGVAGAYFADIALYLFGYLAYLFPVLIVLLALLAYRWHRRAEAFNWTVFGVRFAGFVATVIAGCTLATLHVEPVPGTIPLSATSGGVLGTVLAGALGAAFNFLGATLLSLAVFLAGITLFTGLSWLKLMDWTGRGVLALVAYGGRKAGEFRDYWAGRRARRERSEARAREKTRNEGRKPPQIQAPPPEKEKPKKPREEQIPLFTDPAPGVAPPVTLLDSPPEQQGGYSKEALEAMSRQVELKLRDFGVEVEVVAVQPGPVITRFELQPAAGVKVSQISNLAKDLARALSVTSVRVVEVIPGKSVVGLEIPNERRQLIAFSEIIRSSQYEKANAPLSLAIGKDIGGDPVVVDLARMPHLLVAGTTGSGKSVGVNAMILSMLYKNQPADVRLIMIDPKMLELSVYDDIPHLLAPVVTDMKEAANALRWCVAEMERRYRLMAALGVRNISGCNRKIEEARNRGEPLKDPLWKPPEEPFIDEAPSAPELEPMPYIVVVVDEFADMMMMVGKKVEELIARLAQKARASGIHLILATQRPSVDVITGLIKANIPTRMAFQVSSKVDSRTILDQMGAESLLGHGDMLYLGPSSRGMPERVHGAFVSDAEVHRVAEHLKGTGQPDYVEEVLQEPGSDSAAIPGLGTEGDGADGESDPLYDQAVRVVTETRKASISGVQRRLKIGYNRAARLVEEMESAGIVGPLQSNGGREVIAPPPKD